MRKSVLSHLGGALLGLCVCLTFAGAPALSAEQTPPQVTKDGLVLQKQTPQRLVYLRPGAKFSQYARMAVLDCYVEFQKNWAREYNQDVISPDQQVTDADIQRMKSALSSEFKKVFVAELTKGGYPVVDFGAADVLVLRPALVNVAVTAPDLMTPGIDPVVVRSAGQATLYLELWDSTSNTILARVMDTEAAQYPFAEAANRVTNTAAADTVLRNWADELVRHLDAVHGKPTGK
ncbi:MAG TPA: DUF3313 family protein [Steroidobacteraceae bacterium]|nr:DUF3313 family protein [Steroidobacteraceae bacterium]